VSETREATLRYYRLERTGFLRLSDYIERFCEEHTRTPRWTENLTPRRKDAKDSE